MLIKFSLENWMSFRDEATFSMVASRERQHGERLPKVGKYNLRLLPIAAVYGGNASGKTNLFKALNFARDMVVEGTKPENLIAVEAFRLDSVRPEAPSRFAFELLINDTIYDFSFSLDRRIVHEERLVEILSASERVLYERKGDQVTFDASLDEDLFLKFAFQGTRENQLFITNAVHQKVEQFKPVYDWFRHNLVLIAPDARFEPFEQFLEEESPTYGLFNATLAGLDTGIVHLGGEPVSFDNLPWPDELKTKIQEEVKDGVTMRVQMNPGYQRYLITRKAGKPVAKKMVAYHRDASGKEVEFDMQHESDGTTRIIDMLPMFLVLAAQTTSKTVVIDELDRSLHTLLTRQLLENYLASCGPQTRSQLLFTTHDVLVMDQKLLRRDEMWITERDKEGGSSLLSFSEYKDVRYDKDLRKSYLQGRMGGVPRILLPSGVGDEGSGG